MTTFDEFPQKKTYSTTKAGKKWLIHLSYRRCDGLFPRQEMTVVSGGGTIAQKILHSFIRHLMVDFRIKSQTEIQYIDSLPGVLMTIFLGNCPTPRVTSIASLRIRGSTTIYYSAQ